MHRLNLLIIEDSEDDALILLSKLKKSDYDVDYKIVESEEDFKKSLSKKEWDAIIDDYNVPGFSGNHALEVFKKTGIDIPFIVISGSINAEEAVNILKSGAHDYINKNSLLRLPHVLEREIKDAKVRSENRQYVARLKENQATLRTALRKTIETIGDIVEKRDPYTSGHQKRVSNLALAIAEQLGLEEEQKENIIFSSLIHDLGKITIPASILSKPGKLSEIEMEMIQAHPASGYDIIKNNSFMQTIGKIIYQHHERLNGSGYPDKIKGDSIMLEAKIIGVADVVEAMSSHRPYRAALGLQAALKEISSKKGALYDEDVVNACNKVCSRKDFSF
jgi:putative two-component system response regulator